MDFSKWATEGTPKTRHVGLRLFYATLFPMFVWFHAPLSRSCHLINSRHTMAKADPWGRRGRRNERGVNWFECQSSADGYRVSSIFGRSLRGLCFPCGHWSEGRGRLGWLSGRHIWTSAERWQDRSISMCPSRGDAGHVGSWCGLTLDVQAGVTGSRG